MPSLPDTYPKEILMNPESSSKQQPPQRIIAIANLKGGVGKTSISAMLGLCYAQTGHRVLLVDLDPQASLTDFALRNEDPDSIRESCSFHLLTERLDLDSVTRATQFGFEIVPAAPILATTGAALASDNGAVLRFRRALAARNHTIIIIDCPPSLSAELRAGLYAADTVMIPIGVDRWTLQGLQVLINEVSKTDASTGRTMKTLAVPSVVTPMEATHVRAVLDGYIPLAKTSIFKNQSVRKAMNKGTEPGNTSMAEAAALAADILEA